MKQEKIRIALAQLAPAGTVNQALEHGLQVCRDAAQQTADVILFPEMWQYGYCQKAMQQGNAIDLSNKFIQAFCQVAKQHSIAVGMTFLGKGAVKPTNSFVLIDMQGNIILQYAKVHLCCFGNGPEDGIECGLQAGDSFKVATLTYTGGSLEVGAMICFDREFPESARTLMLKGAELILVPNACKMQECEVLGDVRLQQLRARAFENMCAIALTNYPAPWHDGASCVIGPAGDMQIIADSKPQIIYADLDVAALKKWRQKEVWGNTHRTTKAYVS